MQDILAILHALQTEAYNKGVHSFQINAWNLKLEDEEETTRAFFVVVFLTGDDSDDDYLSVDIYDNGFDHTAQIDKIKEFIGV